MIEIDLRDSWTLDKKEAIHRRERIQIRTSNGKSISTFVQDIEMVNRRPNDGGVCFSLPHPITPQDIPQGSELWLERDGAEPLIEP